MLQVLLPYEITLFSNFIDTVKRVRSVLLPYEITLFSNVSGDIVELIQVLLPYEITLFSNGTPLFFSATPSFTTL